MLGLALFDDGYRFVRDFSDALAGLLPLRNALESIEANLSGLQADNELLRDIFSASHLCSVFIMDEERCSKNLGLMLGRGVRAFLRKVADAGSANNPKHRHAMMQNAVGKFMGEGHAIPTNTHSCAISYAALACNRYDALGKLGFGIEGAKLGVVHDNKD